MLKEKGTVKACQGKSSVKASQTGKQKTYHKFSCPPTPLSCISDQLSKGSLTVRKREKILFDKRRTALH